MSRKGKNIYLRKDGRWEGRYICGRKEDGRCRYGYVYAATYRDVREKLTRKREETVLIPQRLEDAEKGYRFAHNTDDAIYHMRDKHVEKTEFRTITAEWLEHVRYQVKESSYAKYCNIVNTYIIPELGSLDWEYLSPGSLEMFCRRLLVTGGKSGQGLAPKTVADIMSVIRNIFHYTSARGRRPPCDLSSISIKRESKEMRIFSREEQFRLCQCLYTNMTALDLGILIALFTGMRIGEICALRWEDISLSEQTIYVHRTLQRIQTVHAGEREDDPNKSHTRKTGPDSGKVRGTVRKTEIIVSSPKSQCSIRHIPIICELNDILASFPHSRTGYVLTGSENKSIEPRAMQRYFRRVLKKAQLEPVNFHALRHTFATRCIEVNFDLKSLSEILGHANVNITLNRYVHPSMDMKRENMQRLSELFAVR